MYSRSKKTLNCLIRSSNLCTNRSILTSVDINIIKSKMVCGQCPPYGISDVISITYGTLRERIISTLIVGEACHLSETLRERQSIVITLNINTNKSKMFCGQCPPYGIFNAVDNAQPTKYLMLCLGIFDIIHPSLNPSNSLPLG
jgi:hypothetical protein